MFPGCGKEFDEIFGTQLPEVRQVARWKNKWMETTPYQFVINNKIDTTLSNYSLKKRINDVCNKAGIHPYFWEFRERHKTQKHTDGVFDDLGYEVITLQPLVSFYKGEHLVMFKLLCGYD